MGHHLYAEVTADLTVSSNDHNQSLPATHTISANETLSPLPGDYEDIDIKPLMTIVGDDSPSPNRHDYETVASDEGKHGSSTSSDNSHIQALSRSLSVTRRSPLRNTEETVIFDNPKYNNLRIQHVKKHVNIYRSVSSDSNTTSGEIRQQWSANVPPQTPSRSDGYEECLVEDEPEPTGEYKKDTDYALPIVSTDDQYISENGHVYLMLGEVNAPGKEEDKKASLSPPNNQVTMLKRKREVKESIQVGESNSLLGNTTIFHFSPDTEDSTISEFDYDVLNREHQQITRHTSSTSDDMGYDVIDRGDKKFLPKRSGVSETQYDVTDRPVQLLRGVLSNPQVPFSNYNLIGGATRASSVRGHATALSKCPRLPLYSSLELSQTDQESSAKRNAGGPFYEVLDLEKKVIDKPHQHKGEVFYHTVEPERQDSVEAFDNVIYHAIP